MQSNSFPQKEENELEINRARMTSTSFNVGIGDGSRLSSRVLRPPGGGHTDIFGGEPEPPRAGGRRPAPSVLANMAQGQGDEPAKPTNGDAPSQNGQASDPQPSPVTPEVTPSAPTAPIDPPAPVEAKEVKSDSPKAVTPTEPSKPDAPKRVRVPPGGFSSGLWYSQTGHASSKLMESSSNTGSGRQSRLLGRLLGKLRGEHRCSGLDKHFSFTSTGMSESIGCGSTNEEEDVDAPRAGVSTATIDDTQFAANIDLRYGGQYLTPEQLPEFCNQLHHLVEVIRNIQSYAKVTGEYPSELERRLEREAREVAALASEARNAREAASRARLQRRALRAQRAQLVASLAKLRDTEVRELETSVRVSDRKLFKSWEALRDATDPAAFEPLLEEIRNKQTALECLVRLIECRRANLSRPPTLQPLPAPSNEDEDSVQIGSVRKRQDSRRSNKRKRKEAAREPRSVPLSGETSRHSPQQVTLFIRGTECASRLGAGSAGAVTLRSVEMPPRASVRDILFFTTD